MALSTEAGVETAKAVQEVAKTTSKALSLVEGLGTFLNKLLGSPIQNAVGIAIDDPLREFRIRNLARLTQRTDAILSARKVREPQVISPSLLLPLMEAAQDEASDELREMWARLLANGADPSRSGNLRREFIEALRRFHPRDALILVCLRDTPNMSPTVSQFLSSSLKISTGAVAVSIANLQKLECVEKQPTGATTYITDFGRELLAACAP